eukprot:gb/GEZN01003619.1/.p1 GENE.gb/GEZN01003619.1/~~gb/GEZN01003619.1/.p1  ORF type:complete len:628 (+),score=64.94 gb/GEZN01003619.1/:76-1959(+)
MERAESLYSMLVSNLTGALPCKEWIATYSWRYLQKDLSVGLTTGVMVVPQGLAYAALAGLPPVYGLYSSMLPCVVYAFLGTSRDLTVGPFALVSLLVGDGVKKALGNINAGEHADLTIRATMGMSFIVGVIFLVLAALRFGNVTCMLSKTVLSGFTTAAAVLIATSQATYLVGLSNMKRGDFLETWEQIFHRLDESNIITVGISVVAILVLLIGKWINKKYEEQLPMPLMMELVVVVISSVLVYFLELDSKYGVGTVGVFPAGLPKPLMPYLDLQLLVPSIVVALTTFIVSSSVAKAFGQRSGYSVDPNQELLALGMANFLGAFFRDYPSSGSLSRSALVDSMGSATPFHNLISAAVVALVLLTLTKPLQYLPHCILSAIICTSLTSLLMQVVDPVHLWSRSRVETCVWIVTFFSTLFLGTELGIGIGVIVSILPIVLKVTNADFIELGLVPETIVYRSVGVDAKQIPGLLLLRFDAPLNFTNQERFQSQFLKIVNEKDDLVAVVLECQGIADIDILALDMIPALVNKLSIPVIWVSPVGHTEKLKGSGVIYNPQHNLHEAVTHAVHTFVTPRTEISGSDALHYSTSVNTRGMNGQLRAHQAVPTDEGAVPLDRRPSMLEPLLVTSP